MQRMPPQAKHRKTSNSVNDAVFGSMNTSTIGILQVGHDGGVGSRSVPMLVGKQRVTIRPCDNFTH
jgi:hypothetical protein